MAELSELSALELQLLLDIQDDASSAHTYK